MCYSAQIRQDFRKYTKLYGADIGIQDFVRLYWQRQNDTKIKIPKAMDAQFAHPDTPEEREIKRLIDAFDLQQTSTLEQELFKQRKRLADAERTLQSKTTKAATDSKRIATDKIAWILGKLSDLRRTEPKDRDSRIFPGHYAPVMVMEHGKRVIKPMRYQCRLEGQPASHDTKFPGCYNARRDNLEGFWRRQFAVTHGLVIVNAFYENVSRHRVEGRELLPGEKDESLVLEFRPTLTQDMLVACLWSHWHAPEQPELLSFAAITDDPPSEVAAAGHDRCIIPIKPEHIDAWLDPTRNQLPTQYAILDDRERPNYQHRMAA